MLLLVRIKVSVWLASSGGPAWMFLAIPVPPVSSVPDHESVNVSPEANAVCAFKNNWTTSSAMTNDE